MHKKGILILLAAGLLLPMTSCSSASFAGSIVFYDGDTELGTIAGPSGTKISDDTVLSGELAGYEEKSGYAFRGWYTDKTLTAGSKIDINAIPFADLSVYGSFLAEVTVTLDADGGTFPADAVTTYQGIAGDQIPSDFPTPTKDESSFDGWYSGSDLFDSDLFPAQSVTLKAHYADWPTLSFETDVAGYAIDPVKVAPGAKVPDNLIDASKLTKGNMYKFDAWYEDQTFKTAFNFDSMPNHSLTIYAHFLQKHTISFVTNVPGYSGIDPIVGFAGDPIEAPDFDPTQMKITGKYFDSWYASQDLSGTPFSFVKMPDADVTLYAKWSDDPVITLLDSDKSTSLGTISDCIPGAIVDISSYVTFPAAHAHDTFLGWFYVNDDTRYVADPSAFEIPDASLSLYAKYRTNYQLTVRFISPEGTFLDSSLTPYDDIYGNDIADPSAAVDSYLASDYPSTYGDASLYRLLGFYKTGQTLSGAETGLDMTQVTPIDFPLGADGPVTAYAVIAGKVTLTLSKEVAGAASPLGTVSGFDSEAIGIAGLSIDQTTGEYLVYGKATGLSSASYVCDYSYDAADAGTRLSLPSVFPAADHSFVAHFVPRPSNT